MLTSHETETKFGHPHLCVPMNVYSSIRKKGRGRFSGVVSFLPSTPPLLFIHLVSSWASWDCETGFLLCRVGRWVRSDGSADDTTSKPER